MQLEIVLTKQPLIKLDTLWKVFIDFRFHDLRHSCASYLAMNSCSTVEIAGVLGHKTLQMIVRWIVAFESDSIIRNNDLLINSLFIMINFTIFTHWLRITSNILQKATREKKYLTY